jgi:hypothetical protein
MNATSLSASFLSGFVSTTATVLPTTAVSFPASSSSHYTCVELVNVHFIHSMALHDHIICSRQATQLLFPLVIHHDKQSQLNDQTNIILVEKCHQQ